MTHRRALIELLENMEDWQVSSFCLEADTITISGLFGETYKKLGYWREPIIDKHKDKRFQEPDDATFAQEAREEYRQARYGDNRC